MFNPFVHPATGRVSPARVVATGSVATALALAAALVAPFEGFASKPYVDRVGTGHPITWCYGETKADGPVPPMNKVFTKAECTAQLQVSLEKYDKELLKCVKVPMKANVEAALISFSYNLGTGTTCKYIAPKINAGQTVAACNALLAFDHANGVRLAGLTRRRVAERKLCLDG